MSILTALVLGICFEIVVVAFPLTIIPSQLCTGLGECFVIVVVDHPLFVLTALRLRECSVIVVVSLPLSIPTTLVECFIIVFVQPCVHSDTPRT